MKQGTKNKYIIPVCLGLLYFVIGSGYQYSDLLITTSCGIELWTALFSGNFFDFYNITYTDIVNSGYMIVNGVPGYDFLMYVIFAIWNFPLWLAKYIFKINIWESVLALIWAKGIVFLFSILVGKKISDIALRIGMEKEKIKLAIGLFFTSTIYAIGTLIMSQYDVIYLWLLLISIDYYLQNDMKKFIIFSAIAFPIKSISFFVFIPLLLYKEKDIIKIILSLICELIPWGILKLLFERNDNSGIFDNMLCIFANKITIMDYEIPLFPFVMLIFYVMCYLMKTHNDKKEFDKTTIAIAFLSYQIFVMICLGNPYWAVVLLPFQIFLIIYDNVNWLTIILCTLSDLCYVVNRIWEIQWSVNVNVLKASFIGKTFGERADETNDVIQLLHKELPAVYEMAEDRLGAYTYGGFLVFSILLIYIVLGKKHINIEQKESYLYLAYAFRIVCSIFILLLPIIAFIF